MPYPNYHSFRMKSPDLFDKESFKIKKLNNGIMLVLARPKSGGSFEVQSYRFNKDNFSYIEAKEWMNKHKKKPIEKSKAINEKLYKFNRLVNKFLQEK